jgi:hypothetical protein
VDGRVGRGSVGTRGGAKPGDVALRTSMLRPADARARAPCVLPEYCVCDVVDEVWMVCWGVSGTSALLEIFAVCGIVCCVVCWLPAHSEIVSCEPSSSRLYFFASCATSLACSSSLSLSGMLHLSVAKSESSSMVTVSSQVLSL